MATYRHHRVPRNGEGWTAAEESELRRLLATNPYLDRSICSQLGRTYAAVRHHAQRMRQQGRLPRIDAKIARRKTA